MEKALTIDEVTLYAKQLIYSESLHQMDVHAVQLSLERADLAFRRTLYHDAPTTRTVSVTATVRCPLTWMDAWKGEQLKRETCWAWLVRGWLKPPRFQVITRTETETLELFHGIPDLKPPLQASALPVFKYAFCKGSPLP